MLDQIIETKKQELLNFTMPEPIDVLPSSFFQALSHSSEIALIAEVKKASPSKGVIKEDFDPLSIGKDYERGGANAISVLTERVFFKGDPEFLKNIKQEVSIPILRKDFIVDERQIEESKRLGADAILLISEALDPKQLYEFYLCAEELGLDCLVEVHSQQSLENVLSIFEPKIIGVNNRNLSTFETRLEQTKNMATFIPKQSIFVSESGIHNENDMKFVKDAGAKAVLVGESLMKAPSPIEGIEKLYGSLKQK